MRLHRLITGMSKRRVWEMMREGKQLEEIITKDTPEEFQKWGKKCYDELLAEHYKIKSKAALDYVKINMIFNYLPDVPRKRLAEEIKKYDNPHLIFAIHDKKPLNGKIWKLIKPPAETFRRDFG